MTTFQANKINISNFQINYFRNKIKYRKEHPSRFEYAEPDSLTQIDWNKGIVNYCGKAILYYDVYRKYKYHFHILGRLEYLKNINNPLARDRILNSIFVGGILFFHVLFGI